MRALIAGNWKMNGRLADAGRIAAPVGEAAASLSCDLLVCPPATLLAAVAQCLAGSAATVGAQDCHAAPDGAHTGDLSAAMLRDAGATWVILGHSERRADHGETDAIVRAKAVAAQAAGLAPIVCVGETEAERQAGTHLAVVRRQLAGSLPDGFAGVVAYEPVWAIGSGRTPTLEQVAEMHGAIRDAVGAGVRILYGGSVKPANAAELLAVPEVGGALVGGASLKAGDFLAIARAVPGG
ncbi:MAG TPA: triose-phosphate isomerase [Acetobacteraceae bacterium]|nr:triose-phosphate isomerase [Acetobacteraceae bacterium]